MIDNFRFSHRRGFTLLETLLTLVVLMVISGLAAIMWANQRDIQTARTLAYRQATLLAAAQNYLASNSSTLIIDVAGGPVAIPAGRLTSSGAQPVGSDGLPSLQSGGFINSQYIDINQYSQNSWLVVRAGATANSLEGIIFTTGGQAIPDFVLGTAMQFIGADGGYIPNNPINGQANKIVGSKGGWIANSIDFTVGGLATPTAGHLAAWIALTPNSGVTGDFLWRTNTGVAENNRMHTDIDVGQHDLNHVSQITGGPAASPDPGSSTQTAINIAGTIVPSTTPDADATLSAATAPEYEDGTGKMYPYYARVDGNNRFKRLDASVVIDNNSWDSQGGTSVSPRSYPTGTRLIDALPSIVIQSSYVAQDNTVVPKPQCGNPSSPPAIGTYERIFATPLSNFDYVAPSATTTSTMNYTTVPVINSASLSQVGSAITINTTTDNAVNAIQSVTSTTVVDASGLSSKIYAMNNPLDGGLSWVFHAQRQSGPYVTDALDPRFQQPLTTEVPFGTYATTYPSDYLIQTACYYGP